MPPPSLPTSRKSSDLGWASRNKTLWLSLFHYSPSCGHAITSIGSDQLSCGVRDVLRFFFSSLILLIPGSSHISSTGVYGLGWLHIYIYKSYVASLVPPPDCTSAAWGGMDLDRNSEKALGLWIVHVRAQSSYFSLISFSQDWSKWVFLNSSRVKRNAWCFGKAGAGKCRQRP